MKLVIMLMFLVFLLGITPVDSLAPDEPTLGNELKFPEGWQLEDFSIRNIYSNGSHVPSAIQQVFICSKTDDNVTIYRYCKPTVTER